MSHEELENTDKHDFLTFMLTKGGVKMSTLIQNTLDLLFAGVETVRVYTICMDAECMLNYVVTANMIYIQKPVGFPFMSYFIGLLLRFH